MEDADDAIPRVNWGKYVERDGRWMLNITFTANHRFIDGYHIGLFFERLQKAIDELEGQGEERDWNNWNRIFLTTN